MGNDKDGFENWFEVSYNAKTNKKCGELTYSLQTKNAKGEFETLKTTDKAQLVDNKYL